MEHPPDSTSHGRFGPSFDQSMLLTSMLHETKIHVLLNMLIDIEVTY